MKLFLAVFGKAGSPFVSDEVARYVKRLKGSASPLEVVELKESKRDDKLKALAEEAAILYNNPNLASPNIIPELDPMRYAVIDTMEDTLCNVVGGLLVYVGLRIKPYNHTGKNNVNILVAEETRIQVQSTK